MALAGAHVVRWARPSRRLSADESSDFFDAPLRRLTLFSFVTRDLKVAPHRGPLSLKTVFSGEEHYQIGRRRVTLRPGEALLVNADAVYASAIEGQTELLSIFIPERKARDALAAAANASGLLDDARATDAVFAQAPLANSNVSASLLRLRGLVRRKAAGGVMDAAVEELLVDAFAANRALAPPQALTHLRRATRDEIVTRIARARSFMLERGGEGCALVALAELACMSPYHFLRRFRELCGETPGAFARRLRLNAAQDAMARGAPKRLTARRAGYRSMEAFERALRRAE